ncbi:Ig-like domain-containing protein, partial [Vibrio lentus]|uniref:Ig-like domain-containing protein n=1 Tax=Vibrio lentus TaxID=136468 RepID=UPI003BB1D322
MATESDSGRTDSDGITNDTTPTFNGTAEKGADVTVVIFDDGGNEVTTITVRANDEGYWSANSATELDDGQYTWEVTVTDLAGNTTTSEPQDLTID